VPISFGPGKAFNIGKQPWSVELLGYYNAVNPGNGSAWSVSVGLSMLFP